MNIAATLHPQARKRRCRLHLANMREVIQDGKLSIPCLGVALTLDDIFDGVL
ncbi:hypothetical protein ACFOPQ_06960 [Deinococcus antarcticus]|uniref:Uncharacterized protein n=1 Tax=Deinococcus antarcticus TaxID=1298767 RepID=A0ABV8A4C5_9DEIO